MALKNMIEPTAAAVDLAAPANDQTVIAVMALQGVSSTIEQVEPVAEQVVLPEATTHASEKEAWAAELCGLEQKMAEFKALTDRREELRKRLLHQLAEEGHPPAQEVKIKTQTGIVVFSSVSQSYKLSDAKGVMDKLGQDVYLQITKPGVTDLKKVLTDIELLQFGGFQPGARTMKVTLL